MRSSGSTRNPSSRPPISLHLLVVGDDHPRACTGRQLLRLGLARRAGSSRPPRGSPVVLDPRADVPLSFQDRRRAGADGVLVVDCSWNQLGNRGGYPTQAPWLATATPRRRLPWLLAGNPQHYGRLGELNTAEASAAAVVILGERGEAERLLAPFRGGSAFFQLNRALFESYCAADGPDEIRRAESEFF